MKIMVIDRDSLTNQLISSKLEAKGHTVTTYQNKNEAFDVLRSEDFDCVMVDPAPLSEPKPVVIAVWRHITATVRPYLLLLTKTATTEEAVLAGANDVLNKPFSSQDIEVKLKNAERLMEICRHLAREDNVHSESGMIGKAAFNQIFLSAIDRAFRYGERSDIVFIHCGNYEEMTAALGEEAVHDALKKLNEKLTFTRRQSDVIGRLGQKDYAIMLQRTQTENEPLDAFNRFAEMLDAFHDSFSDAPCAPKFELHLVEIPQGAMHAERLVPIAQVTAIEQG
jgi:PleD family two-component response regulator